VRQNGNPVEEIIRQPVHLVCSLLNSAQVLLGFIIQNLLTCLDGS